MAKPLITLRNTHLRYGPKTLFDAANVEICEGDRIGVIGPNGAGKSSLFKILHEEIVPDPSTPKFEFHRAGNKRGTGDFTDVFLVPQELPAECLKGNFQDVWFYFRPELAKAYNDFMDLSDGSNEKALQRSLEVMEELQYWEHWNSFESCLKQLDIDDLTKNLSDCSGGQQKKALLALGLSAKEAIILWDEPTNHLDLEAIESFEDELSGRGKTFLLISHDRYLLSKTTNKTVLVERGAISTFKGGYEDFLKQKALDEEQNLKWLTKMKNTFTREQAWMRQGIKARGTRSKKRVENFENLGSEMEKIKSRLSQKLEIGLEGRNQKAKKLCWFEEADLGYDAKSPLLEDLTLTLWNKRKVGILGRNGAGKSTLVKSIMGDVPPTKGLSNRRDGLIFSYFHQTQIEAPEEMTPHEYIGEGNDFINLMGKDGPYRRHVVSHLEKFLFHRDDVKRPLKYFSGGEKRRLLLAKNLSNPGDVWIFDEPTNDLDLESIGILEQALADFQGSALIISHDRAFLSNTCDEIWAIVNKKLHVFTSGLDDALAFLQLSDLEQTKDGESGKSEAIARKKVKLTYKQKQRLKELPNMISQFESELEGIEKSLSTMDYSSLDTKGLEELKQLSERRDHLEEEILQGMSDLEEWSD